MITFCTWNIRAPHPRVLSGGTRFRLPSGDSWWSPSLTASRFPRRVADSPKLGVLREGLRLFISHFLLKSAHAGTEEADALRARADLAAKALHGRATVRM